MTRDFMQHSYCSTQSTDRQTKTIRYMNISEYAKSVYESIRKFFKSALKSLRKHWALFSGAVGITIVMLVLCYIYDNIPHSLLGSANVAQRYEIAKTLITGANDKVPDNVLLVNIAYDRELVEYYYNEQPDFAAGKVAIADRDKLYEFFTQLSENPTYIYIMCDVRFEPNRTRPGMDDTLYNAIANTPRLVIPMHQGEEPADERLRSKAGYCDYAVNFVESNFVKYEFLKNGHPSMPLKAYNEITGKDIARRGLLYTSDSHLCRKCVELKFPVRIYSDGTAFTDNINIKDKSGKVNATRRIYYNLGSDILDIGLNLAKKAKDKIIVIGDFSGGDNHSTYLGALPGAVINYNALCALIEGDHIISYTEIALLFTLYLLITIYILRGRSVFQTFVPYKLRIGIMRRMLAKDFTTRVLKMLRPKGAAMILWSFAGIGMFLCIVSVLCYIFTGVIIYLFIPTLVFTLLKNIVIYVKLRKASVHRSRRSSSLNAASQSVAR